MPQFSERSKDRLINLHPHLAMVAGLAITITEIDFAVLETSRSIERQRELLASGASSTMNSRHIVRADDPGSHAVDLGAYVGGRISWDWPLYHQIAAAMKRASGDLGIPVEWGGDWRSFPDGPHFQLPWETYP